jgi:hypothetical protein
MEDNMPNLLRYATLSAALLAGTAAVHAQTVIMEEPAYAPPAYAAPTYVAPAYAAPAYVAPAPIVAAPATTIVAPAPAPAVIARPAPIYAQAPITQEIVAQPQTERVQETVIRREATQPRTSHRTRTTRVHLTAPQRREVLRTIRYERSAAPAVRERIATPVSYGVGSVLPPSVQTYALPRQVMYEAPALQGYAYAPVGNRVLLVEPANNMVVDELY